MVEIKAIFTEKNQAMPVVEIKAFFTKRKQPKPSRLESSTETVKVESQPAFVKQPKTTSPQGTFTMPQIHTIIPANFSRHIGRNNSQKRRI